MPNRTWDLPWDFEKHVGCPILRHTKPTNELPLPGAIRTTPICCSAASPWAWRLVDEAPVLKPRLGFLPLLTSRHKSHWLYEPVYVAAIASTCMYMYICMPCMQLYTYTHYVMYMDGLHPHLPIWHRRRRLRQCWPWLKNCGSLRRFHYAANPAVLLLVFGYLYTILYQEWSSQFWWIFLVESIVFAVNLTPNQKIPRSFGFAWKAEDLLPYCYQILGLMLEFLGETLPFSGPFR
jgi:hypothetical protein